MRQQRALYEIELKQSINRMLYPP